MKSLNCFSANVEWNKRRKLFQVECRSLRRHQVQMLLVFLQSQTVRRRIFQLHLLIQIMRRIPAYPVLIIRLLVQLLIIHLRLLLLPPQRLVNRPLRITTRLQRQRVRIIYSTKAIPLTISTNALAFFSIKCSWSSSGYRTNDESTEVRQVGGKRFKLRRRINCNYESEKGVASFNHWAGPRLVRKKFITHFIHTYLHL